MMKQKKTFAVDSLREIVNGRNRFSTCSPEIRRGWNAILIDILYQSGNYKGFCYLKSEEIVGEASPGISRDENGKVIFPDDTRINFF